VRPGRALLVAGVVAGLTSGCFALMLGGLTVRAPGAQATQPPGDLSTQGVESKVTLKGGLSVPANLSAVEPLNAVEPLTAADPLTLLSPLIGNAGAGLAGNAGSSLIGNAGAGLAGNSGSGLTVGAAFVPAAEFYRLLAASLPSILPAATVQVVNPQSGEVVGSGEASGATYTVSVPGTFRSQGLIVQALFKKGSDVLAFLASPVSPTAETATADLSLGTTLATFTAARLANVAQTDLKLDKGFTGLKSPALGALSSATKTDQTDLTAASNLCVTSTAFKKMLDTAGSLSREVATTAQQKAKEAIAAGQTLAASESVQVAAALSVINKVAEVVDGEKTLGKALDRAATEVKAEDVARRAEAKPDVKTAPKFAGVVGPDDVATAVDRVAASLACAGSQFFLAWQSGGRQARGAYPRPAGAEAATGEGVAPILTPGASNLLGFARVGEQIAVAAYDASGSAVGTGRTFDPVAGFDRYAAAGGKNSAILAFDGPGTILGLLLSATPSLRSAAELESSRLGLSDSATLGKAPRDARRPAAVSLGDAYLVVWDEADGDGIGRRIVGRFVSSAGDLVKADPVRIYPPKADGRLRGGAAVAVGTAGFLVAWTEDREGFADVSAIRVNFDGTLEGQAFDVANAVFDQRNPTLAWTGTRFAVAWDDRRNQNMRVVGARLVSPKGELGEELVLGAAGPYAETPIVGSCAGQAAVAWFDGSTPAKPKLRAIRARIVD